MSWTYIPPCKCLGLNRDDQDDVHDIDCKSAIIESISLDGHDILDCVDTTKMRDKKLVDLIKEAAAAISRLGDYLYE